MTLRLPALSLIVVCSASGCSLLLPGPPSLTGKACERSAECGDGRCVDGQCVGGGGGEGGGSVVGVGGGRGGGAVGGGAAGGGAAGGTAGGETGGGASGGGAPMVDAAASTLVVTPDQVTANGVAQAAVTVTLRGPQGQFLAGVETELRYAGTASIAPGAMQPSDASGVVRFTLTALAPTTGQLTAVAGGVTLATMPSLTFVPRQFTVGGAITGLSAPGLVLASPGQQALTVAAGARSFTFGAPQDEGSSYAVTVSAEPPSLSCAVDGGVGLVGGNVTTVLVACSALPPAEASTTLEVTPTNVTAGLTTATVTLTARNQRGGTTAAQQVLLTVSGSSNTLQAVGGMTDQSGVFTTTFSSTVAEAKTVTAAMGGTAPWAFMKTAPVVVHPGPPHPVGSTFVASPAALAADGVAATTLTLTARDQRGNVLAGMPVALTGPDAGSVVAPTSGVTDDAGVFTATWRSTVSGQRFVSAEGGDAGTFESVVATFLAGPPVAANTRLTVSPPTVLANGAAASTVTFSVGDVFGNPVNDAPVSLLATGLNVSLDALTGRTTATGDFSARVRSSRAQASVLTATAGTVTKDAGVTFTAPAGCSGTYSAPVSTSLVWTGARDVVLADLTGDGPLDLVAIYSDRISTAVGNGNATFQAGTTPYTNNIGMTRAAAGDFNADGRADLAVTYSSGVIIHNGGAGGTLTQPGASGLLMSPAPNSVAVANLNADTRPDVVSVSTQVHVFLATGSNTFAARADYAAGSNPGEVHLADLNGDGARDIVVTNSSQNVVNVLLNAGAGTFNPAVAYPAGASPTRVVAFDVNRDTIPDLVVSSSGAANLTVLRGNGNGTFLAPTTLTLEFGSGDLAVGDVNGDGRLDLAVGAVSWVALLLADATGLRPAQYVENSQNRDVVWLADLTGDGRPELLTAQTNANQVFVNRYLGTDGLQPARFVAAGTAPSVVEAVDCNRDDLTDLLVVSTNTVGRLLGQASAVSLGASSPLTVSSTPTAVTTADFDGDGLADLAHVGAAGAWVHRATGDCTWVASAQATNLSLGGSPAGLVAADFDRDGRPDLATANLGGGVSVALGADGGAFFPFDTYPTGMSTRAIVTGRFNADAFPDLAVVNEASNNLSVLLGAGDGGFLPAASYPTGLTPWALTAGDFNGDGVTDLASANSNSGNVSVLLGNANGTFQAATNFATSMTPRGVRAADLNGDGHLDLVTSNVNGPSIAVLSGTGTGTFQSPVSLPLMNPTGALAVGDFNGDGRVDVMTTTTGNGAVFRALCLP